jgi:hypothetical protein
VRPVSGWLARWFGISGAGGVIPTRIRRYSVANPTLSSDHVTVDGDGWVVDTHEPRVVRLFEIADPDVEQCLLTYRANLKSADLDGRAFLEMWCRFSGKGEFFSKGFNQPLRRTTEWASYEIAFRLKKGQRPDLIKLNLAVEGSGRIWSKDLELLKTPR